MISACFQKNTHMELDNEKSIRLSDSLYLIFFCIFTYPPRQPIKQVNRVLYLRFKRYQNSTYKETNKFSWAYSNLRIFIYLNTYLMC